MKYFSVFFALLFSFSSAFSAGQSAPKVKLSPEYKKWLDEDVRWIITNQERKGFLRLTSDHDRDRFITAFWERRNPNPRSVENAFREEHYRVSPLQTNILRQERRALKLIAVGFTSCTVHPTQPWRTPQHPRAGQMKFGSTIT
jgi:hypothetical protein